MKVSSKLSIFCNNQHCFNMASLRTGKYIKRFGKKLNLCLYYNLICTLIRLMN